MKADVEVTGANQSRAAAGIASDQVSREESDEQFEDNRPEVVAQRELAGKADSSPQANRIAQLQAVANGASTGIVQRDEIDEEEEGIPVRTELDPIQRAGEDETRTTDSAVQKKDEKPDNKTGLPDGLKTGMENLSGISLDHVKVHYNSAQPAAVQAHAYARGNNIHLAPGQERHLPHELGHVVQQEQGKVRPTKTIDGMAVNDDATLEQQATVMGQQALQRFTQGSGESDNQPENAADHITTTVMSNSDYANWKDSIQCQTTGLHGACTIGDQTYVAQFHDPAAVIQMIEWRDKLKIGLVALEGILTITAGLAAAAATGGILAVPGFITACVGVSKCSRAYLMYDIAATKEMMEGDDVSEDERAFHQRRVNGRTEFVDALRGLEAIGGLMAVGMTIADGGLTSKAISLLIFGIAKAVRSVTTAFSNYLDPKHKRAKKILDAVSTFAHAAEVFALAYAADFSFDAAEDTADELGAVVFATVAGSKGARTLDQAVKLFEKKKPKKPRAKESANEEFESPLISAASMEAGRKHRIILMLQSLTETYKNMDQDGIDQLTDQDFGEFVMDEDKKGLRNIVAADFQMCYPNVPFSKLSRAQVGRFTLSNEYGE